MKKTCYDKIRVGDVLVVGHNINNFPILASDTYASETHILSCEVVSFVLFRTSQQRKPVIVNSHTKVSYHIYPDEILKIIKKKAK